MKKLVCLAVALVAFSFSFVSCSPEKINNEDEQLFELQSIDRGESANSGSVRTERDRDNSEG